MESSPSLASDSGGATRRHRCNNKNSKNEKDSVLLIDHNKENDLDNHKRRETASSKEHKISPNNESEETKPQNRRKKPRAVHVIGALCLLVLSTWMGFSFEETVCVTDEGTNRTEHARLDNAPKQAKNLTVWFVPGDTTEKAQKRIARTYGSSHVQGRVLDENVCMQHFERVFGFEKKKELHGFKDKLASKNNASDAWTKARDDLCVLATLFLEGGYYVGRNVTATVTPFVFTHGSRNELAAVLKKPQRKKDSSGTAHKNGQIESSLFDTNSFLASSQPGHPLLREAVRRGTGILLKKESPTYEDSPLLSSAVSRAYETISSQKKTTATPMNLRPLLEIAAPTSASQSTTTPVRFIRSLETQRVHFLLTSPSHILPSNYKSSTPTTAKTGAFGTPTDNKSTKTTPASPPASNPFNGKKPRFLFLMGIEGTGHHLYTSLLNRSPNMDYLRSIGLHRTVLALQSALYNHHNKHQALFSAPLSGKQTAPGKYLGQKVVKMLQKMAEKVVEEEKKGEFGSADSSNNTSTTTISMNNISATGNSDQVYLSIPLNGFDQQGRGEMSYPNFRGELRTLQYPDLHSLYALCSEAQVECGHMYIARNVYEVIKSTTINRKFEDTMAQVRILTTMFHVMEAQLLDFPDKLKGCVDYNDINTTGIPWGVEMLGYGTVEQFEKARSEIYKAKPPKSDEERRKVMPLNSWGVHIEGFAERSEKTMESCLRIHAWNQAKQRKGDGR